MTGRGALHLAAALSGGAGLVWQLLWARELALVLGSTVQAAAVVTAVFLAGLGVGARVAGGWVERVGRPARVYALCELGVALWGLALVPVFPWLTTIAWGGEVVDPRGWLVPGAAAHIGQVLIAVVLLGPPTAAMGASLPLLGPVIVGRRVDRAALRLGVLVAVNTGGAALGALATDLVLVPSLGVSGAALVAAGAGVAAAGIAGLLRARPVEGGAGAGRGIETGKGSDRGGPGRRLSVAVGMIGFAAMGLEIVWLRFLGSALGPYRAVFALLLGVLLVGWLAGAIVAGLLTRRVGPTALLIGAQALVVTLALGGLVAHDPRELLVSQLALAESGATLVGRLGVNLVAVAKVVLPAAIAMGAAFPVASALARPAAGGVGRTVGGLWLATTAGNAAGALVTGLVLLPGLGMGGSALVLALLAASAPLLVVRRPVAAVGLVPAAMFGAWLASAPDGLVWASFPYGRAQEEGVLAVDEGLDATIVVTGEPDGPARLWTNGHPMSSTTPGAQRYMRLLAHVPLLAQEAPRRALVICFGVGNTLHAASLHRSLAELHLADLSDGVLGMAGWFAHANRNVLGDPRVRVHVDDGRRVLRAIPPGLDVITLEPPPIAHAGVAALYSREFYALARSRLAEGGWMAQWLPAYQVPGEVVLSLVAAFVAEFPDAALLVGDGRELLLVGVNGGPATLDVARVRRRMAEPGIAEDLATIGVTDVSDLAALYAAGGAHLREVTEGVRPMDDDHPVAEAGQVSHVATTELPAELLDVAAWPAWAPALADDPALRARMDESAAWWGSEAFRTYSTLPR